jgi:restriction system protein
VTRRKRKFGFEQWIDALAKLPWQVCLALVPVTWLVFHTLSQLRPPLESEPGQLGGVILFNILKTGGLFLQYLVPAALLIAAFTSWIAKRKRNALLVDITERQDSVPLLNMSWQQFESLVAAYFEQQGYRVTMTSSGADGGVDAIARRDGETFLIQCKHWRATQVGVSVVRELFGVMSAQGATGALVVSSGPFTTAAVEFAEGRNIELVDANQLIRSTKSTAPAATSARPGDQPRCPKCDGSMALRTARRGRNSGKQFWGCARYPECRGTVSIRQLLRHD